MVLIEAAKSAFEALKVVITKALCLLLACGVSPLKFGAMQVRELEGLSYNNMVIE